MNLPDFLIDHADGEIRLVGHRIGIYDVIDRYQEGYSPEMLCEEYPALSLALIHRVIAFYQDNRKDVDAYLAEYRAELSRQEMAKEPGPATERIRQSLATKSDRAAVRPRESS
jgi:uncharacterized protein (DUF433 family)